MRAMDKSIKWTMIQQAKEKQQLEENSSKTPEYFIEILTSTDKLTIKTAESLKISLGSVEMDWLQKFIDLKGVYHFFARFKDLIDTPK
jgi:hypothetical protein